MEKKKMWNIQVDSKENKTRKIKKSWKEKGKKEKRKRKGKKRRKKF